VLAGPVLAETVLAETVLAGPEDGLSLEDEFELLDTTLPTPGARRR
jgi:hypothetical protein